MAASDWRIAGPDLVGEFRTLVLMSGVALSVGGRV